MPRLKRRQSLRKGKHHPSKEVRARKWMLRMLVRSQGGCCWYCKKPVPREHITVDHVVPLSRGGLDTVENMRLACSQCNQDKGAGVSLDVFVEGPTPSTEAR